MKQQSPLQIAAEQADRNEERLKQYRLKCDNKAPLINTCSNCGRDSYDRTTCQKCRNNRQQELNESYEHNCA